MPAHTQMNEALRRPCAVPALLPCGGRPAALPPATPLQRVLCPARPPQTKCVRYYMVFGRALAVLKRVLAADRKAYDAGNAAGTRAVALQAGRLCVGVCLFCPSHSMALPFIPTHPQWSWTPTRSWRRWRRQRRPRSCGRCVCVCVCVRGGCGAEPPAAGVPARLARALRVFSLPRQLPGMPHTRTRECTRRRWAPTAGRWCPSRAARGRGTGWRALALPW